MTDEGFRVEERVGRGVNDDAPQALLQTIYIIVSGAGTARRIPELVRQLSKHFERTLVIPTENASRVLSRGEMSAIDGMTIVDSYFDDAILPYPPRGIVLVAPCTFNSLNKLAHGIADTLALSVVAEAIGRATPVIVAVSVNPPLFAHPQTAQSIDRLRSWGIEVIEPARNATWMTLADDEEIIDKVLATRDRFQED